jgi:CHASE3 domain sensor protein
MSDQSEILAKLDQIAKIQKESQAILKENQLINQQSFEMQRKAFENAQVAIKDQMAIGRIYRITLVIGALLIAAVICFLIYYYGQGSPQAE